MGDVKKLYNLGDLGVNLENNPLTHQDGEFLKAQNWVPFHEEGKHGIRRRAGYQQQNTSALNGSVAGFIPVPLPAPNELQLSVADRLGVSAQTAFKASVDAGATWDDVAPVQPATVGYQHQSINQIRRPIANATQLMELGLAYKGTGYLIFATGSASAERAIISWAKDAPVGGNAQNGTLFELIRFPSTDRIQAFWRSGNTLYAGGHGSGGFGNYVYRIDRTTGAFRILAIGTTFAAGTEDILSGAGFIGRQWIGTSRATQGRIHYWRESDTTWTLERTAAANLHTYSSMALYQGNLFAATMALAGTAAIIERRTPGGTWSTSLTGPHSVQANYFDCLWVHNGELFAAYMTRGATDVCSLYKYDGSSWVIDENLALLTTTPSFVQGMASQGTDLFFQTADESGLNGRVWRRNSGGAIASMLVMQTAIGGPLLVI